MDTYLAVLFGSGILFSMMLYFGEQIPWFLSAIAGAFSSLFFFNTGLYWIGNAELAEMGWLFILWAVVNLIITFVVVLSALRAPPEPKTRFD